MRTTPDPYRGCFGLSLSEIETILARRGVVVSRESVRAWGLRLGRALADAPEKRRGRATSGTRTRSHHLPTAVEHRAARDRAFQT